MLGFGFTLTRPRQRAASGGNFPSVSWVPLVIDHTNVTAAQFSISNASAHILYSYRVVSSTGGHAVTGSGRISDGTSPSITLDTLPDGVLTLTLTLLNANGDIEGPFSSGPVTKASFPSDITGIVRGWRFDGSGVITDTNGITQVPPAFGTSDALVRTSGPACPQLEAANGPHNRSIASFFSSQNDSLDFTQIDLNACTIYWVGALKTLNANQTILSRNGASGIFFKASGGTETLISRLQLRTGNPSQSQNSIFVDSVLPRTLDRSLCVLTLRYSTTSVTGGGAGGGTLAAGDWVVTLDQLEQSAAVNVGTEGISFSRFGISGVSGTTNPLDGYVCACIIANRVHTAAERGRIERWLEAEYSTRYRYIDPVAGNDANSGWRQGSPWASVDTACARASRGHEILALKGGVIHRPTVSALLPEGQSANRTAQIDGGLWGNGMADVRVSSAPPLTAETGTIYSFASATEPFSSSSPAGIGYQYVVTGSGLEDVQRLVRSAGNQTTPAAGEWGWASGRVYVNSGTALSGTPIEVPKTFSFINAGVPNQQYRNMWVRFGYGSAGVKQGGVTGIDFFGISSSYHCGDGFGWSGDPSHVCSVRQCYASYNGRFPTDGNSDGDGYSSHGGTVSFTGCVAFMNDKAGFNHLRNAVITETGCLSIGNQPFAMAPNVTSTAGSRTLINCVAVIPASVISSYGAALVDDAFVSNSHDPTFSIRIAHMTAVCEASSAGSRGVRLAAGVENSVIVENCLFDGFDRPGGKGFETPSNATLNKVLSHCATNQFEGTWNGTATLVAGDPLFAGAASRNFTLQTGSPAKNAGVTLTPAVTSDYRGFPRPYGSSPDIGAFERTGS